MNRNRQFVYFLFFIIPIFLQSCEEIPISNTQLVFTPIAIPNEIPRASAMSFELDGEGYILCGRNATKTLKDVWKYNPTNNNWTKLKDFPGPKRVKGIAVNYKGKIYAGLGYTPANGHLDPESYLKDFYSYDKENDTWQKLAEYPNIYTNATIAFPAKDNIYISTGFGRNEATDQTFRYNILDNSWTKVGNYIRATSNAVCAYNNRIFAGTGSPVNVNSWLEFDPINELWVERKSMPDNGRLSAICFENNNYIYVLGGRHWGGDGDPRRSLKDIFEYDILNNVWKKAGELPNQPRESALVIKIQNSIFLGLGENENTIINDFWKVSFNYN